MFWGLMHFATAQAEAEAYDDIGRSQLLVCENHSCDLLNTRRRHMSSVAQVPLREKPQSHLSAFLMIMQTYMCAQEGKY